MATRKSAPARPRAPSANTERRWKAESALDTLARAEQIKKDARLMRDVKAVAKEKVTQISRVAKGR